ncbi:hypothetical protein OG21DRAFT_1433939 [Imleria badia]|nr:hypothetical protein OG21DRAFT_1433939 [Imleria badia]
MSWSNFFPFSSSALASLPENAPRPARYTRQDDIPEQDPPPVRNYNSIQSLPPLVRVPRKLSSAIKVEAKVWFANERTWLSWLTAAILIGTFAVALFNASRDPIARAFAYVYAALSVGVVIYGFYLYQSRITMIRKRDPGHYDAIVGPVVISTFLFVAVLANFIIRVFCSRQHKIPIPGLALLQQVVPIFIPSAQSL